MSSTHTALFVTALILAGMAIWFTAGCRAAETDAEAQIEAAPAVNADNTEAAEPADDNQAETGTATVDEIQAETGATTVEAKYMGLSSGPLSQATIADLPDGIVVQSGDLTVTQKEIDAFIDERASTAEAKKDLRAEAFFVAEQLAVEPLLEREAKAWAAEQQEDPGEAVIDAYIQQIAEQVTVSDEDMRAFYDANRDMVQGAPYDQVKGQLRSMLLRQEQQAAVNEHIAGLGKRQEVTVDAGFLAEVTPKAFDNPVDQARRSGKPTFVDFGSEGCYACDMMAPIIEELETELGDRANVVMIQVREEQYLSSRYGVRSIPVQFIYDKDGREVFDHVGFLSKEAILNELAEVGVE